MDGAAGANRTNVECVRSFLGSPFPPSHMHAHATLPSIEALSFLTRAARAWGGCGWVWVGGGANYALCNILTYMSTLPLMLCSTIPLHPKCSNRGRRYENTLTFTPAHTRAAHRLPWFTNTAAGILVVGGSEGAAHVLEVHLGLIDATVVVDAAGLKSGATARLTAGESLTLKPIRSSHPGYD